jgi:hypothetical protein
MAAICAGVKVTQGWDKGVPAIRAFEMLSNCVSRGDPAYITASRLC